MCSSLCNSTRVFRSDEKAQRLGLAALIVALAVLLAGCGAKEEPSTTAGSTETETTTSTSADDGAPDETIDEPAKLPDGWQTVTNRQAGFSVGIPPGWEERGTPGGQGSVITSPDELITLTITADRTRGALELPLDEFATRTAEALGSDVVGKDQFEDLFVTTAAPFKAEYDASAVRASGKSARTGVEELILVTVVRRPDLASYVIVSRENAEKKSSVADRDDVKEIIRSLRGRPVG
jgi:hypothetical protein